MFQHRISQTIRPKRGETRFAATAAILAVALVSAVPTSARCAETGPSPGEWRSYSADAASTKYLPLDQINRENVGDLRLAWTWESLDETAEPSTRTYRFEPTPLMIDGVLYSSLSSSRVVALNAENGELIWSHDPEAYKLGRPTNLGWVHRGVSHWTDGKEARIFIATGTAELIALDAKTGKQIMDFGTDGRVDLTLGMRRAVNRRLYGVSSPPAICGDVVVVGSSIFDGPTTKEMPPGDVKAYDARTGKMLWKFETIAQPGTPGNETWEDGSWEYTGNANVWTMMSADEELGYVYLPVGTPTNDWYGGHRPGDGLFAESLVCVEAKTGKRVWHYQIVHHGVWDYDLPAAPILCDITVKGKPVKAVVQLTKHGFAFVFDRVTGEPVWPIEERPVPQSDVPGEKTSPTQPHPTRPAPYERQGTTPDDLINFTPELHAEALEILKDYVYGPLFTPPSLAGTINMPGWQGGANWGGGAFDPETGMLYITSITDPIRVTLSEPRSSRAEFRYARSGSMSVRGPKGDSGIELPLFAPPYGRITAIDLNTGDHVWMTPHGEGPKDHPLLKDLNLPDLGDAGRTSCVLTKELLFVPDAAAGMGPSAGPAKTPQLRVYDKVTGERLHMTDMPAYAGGSPMTYMVNGKQFVLVAVGGGRDSSRFAAFSLLSEDVR